MFSSYIHDCTTTEQLVVSDSNTKYIFLPFEWFLSPVTELLVTIKVPLMHSLGCDALLTIYAVQGIIVE